jgi:hypothetical protein
MKSSAERQSLFNMRNEASNPADMNLAGMEPYRRTVDDVLAALGTDRDPD